MKRFQGFQRTAVAGIFILLLVLSVSAQGLFMEDVPSDKAKLGFRYLRPDFKWGGELSFFSGTYDLSVNVPLGSGLNFIGSLPMSVIGVGSYSENSICNISLGIQKEMESKGSGKAFMSVSAFLPTTPERNYEVTELGLYTNFTQMQRYSSLYMTVSGNMAYHNMKKAGFIYGVEFGPNMFIPKSGGEGGVQLNVHYGGYGGLRVAALSLTAELDGMLLVTGGGGDDDGDRIFNRATFGVQVDAGRFKPGIYYSTYLKEELRDEITSVVGFRLQVEL